jgi:serine/threonine-protein kinase
MGAIYAARLSGLAGFEKLAAIKVIHPHLMRNTSFVNMFLDEARLAARIDHPNVVRLHEVGKDGDMLYMVMELVRGQSFLSVAERALSRGEPITPTTCASIGAHVALGLHAAHELRDAKNEPLDLVHRDVCPQNVLISYEGEIKLIDFGVAFARERLAHTQAGKVKGKLRYMAPERLMGQSTDRRSDVYSLGVVVFELARAPSSRPSRVPAAKDPELLALENGEKVGDLPAAFLSVIARATHRTPSRRFGTAAQFAEALESAALTSGGNTTQGELSAKMRRLFGPEEQALNSRLALTSGNEVASIDSIPPDASMTVPAVPRAMPNEREATRTAVSHSWARTLLASLLLCTVIGIATATLLRTGGAARAPATDTPTEPEMHEPGPTEAAISEPVITEPAQPPPVQKEPTPTEAAASKPAIDETVPSADSKAVAGSTSSQEGKTVHREVKPSTPMGKTVKTSTAKDKTVKTSTPKGKTDKTSTPKDKTVKTSTPKDKTVKTSTPRGKTSKETPVRKEPRPSKPVKKPGKAKQSGSDTPLFHSPYEE